MMRKRVLQRSVTYGAPGIKGGRGPRRPSVDESKSGSESESGYESGDYIGHGFRRPIPKVQELTRSKPRKIIIEPAGPPAPRRRAVSVGGERRRGDAGAGAGAGAGAEQLVDNLVSENPEGAGSKEVGDVFGGKCERAFSHFLRGWKCAPPRKGRGSSWKKVLQAYDAYSQAVAAGQDAELIERLRCSVVDEARSYVTSRAKKPEKKHNPARIGWALAAIGSLKPPLGAQELFAKAIQGDAAATEKMQKAFDKIYMGENLKYYQAATKLRDLHGEIGDDEWLTQWQALHDKFVRREAELEINISNDIRKTVTNGSEAPDLNAIKQFLDKSLKEVYSLMQDSLVHVN